MNRLKFVEPDIKPQLDYWKIDLIQRIEFACIIISFRCIKKQKQKQKKKKNCAGNQQPTNQIKSFECRYIKIDIYVVYIRQWYSRV